MAGSDYGAYSCLAMRHLDTVVVPPPPSPRRWGKLVLVQVRCRCRCTAGRYAATVAVLGSDLT